MSGTPACGVSKPLQPLAQNPGLSPLLSIPGCPSKKNVCDSSTCHNGGTCVNQWDAFSCECPLGFGGKSCAQGRRRGQSPGAVNSAGNAGRDRHWAGPCRAGAEGGKACLGRALRG